MRSAILVLLAFLALAGCVSNASAPPPASASVVAASAPADPPSGASASAPVDLGFDGKIPAYAQACAWAAGQFACPYGPPTADFSRIAESPELGGAEASGSASATWNATTPATAGLTLVAYSWDERGGFTSFGWVAGPSPLKLPLRDVRVPAGQTFVIGLFPMDHDVEGPLPAGGWAKASPTEQPFRLDGQLAMS